MVNLAIIIPTLNEAEALPRLLGAFGDFSGMAPLPAVGPAGRRSENAPSKTGTAGGGVELVVVDGGSTDRTVEVARRLGVAVIKTAPGRAQQMNAGAAATRAPWLWFLHADSALPAKWADQLCYASADPRVVGGGFLVQIAARGLRYRFLDGWGWLRTRLTRTFFGDQGIFVRRDVFERLGGFTERPVCEDLEFSDRLQRAGRVIILPGPIRTSARRWQQHGWWRTVAAHSAAVIRYYARRPAPGAPASAGNVHLIIMTKAPVAGQVKTRLVPPLTPGQAAGLAAALLQDTVALVRSVRDGSRVTGDAAEGSREPSLVVAVEPASGVPAVSALLPGVEVIPQVGGDLGARMRAVIEDRLAHGASAVLLIGSDHPTVPRAQLQQAIAWLQEGRDQLVLGPSADGGYCVIGLTRPHPELFREMPWSQADLRQHTVARAASQRLLVRQLASWYDVDTPEDVERLQEALERNPQLAPACHQWLKGSDPFTL